MTPNNPMTEGEALAVEAEQYEKAWPIIGKLYLVKIGGVLQHEVYMFDQGDCEPGGSAPPFWSRDDLDNCPEFDPHKDQWIALDAIDAALTAAQQPGQEGGWECAKCRGTGEVCTGYIDGTPEMFDCTCPAAAPPSAPVGVEGEGEFWTWLRQAYNFTGSGNFTAYNMEVAYQAGRDSALTQQPAQAAPGWKLVPVEPTDTMLREIHGLYDLAARRYAAMLAAAPTPPGDDAAGGRWVDSPDTGKAHRAALSGPNIKPERKS